MKKENINNIKGKAYYQRLRAKYLNLAKEASASGDRILSEYNLQFAEHYSRVMAEKFPPQQAQQQQPQQPQKDEIEPQVQQPEVDQIQGQPQKEAVQPETQKPQKAPVTGKKIIRKKAPQQEVPISE